MWNQRYGSDGFAYGTEPNSFLAENAKLLTGPVLSLAEGEGRNAVFLASLGLAQIPYFVWVSLATVLQLSITVMNWGRP